MSAVSLVCTGKAFPVYSSTGLIPSGTKRHIQEQGKMRAESHPEELHNGGSQGPRFWACQPCLLPSLSSRRHTFSLLLYFPSGTLSMILASLFNYQVVVLLNPSTNAFLRPPVRQMLLSHFPAVFHFSMLWITSLFECKNVFITLRY